MRWLMDRGGLEGGRLGNRRGSDRGRCGRELIASGVEKPSIAEIARAISLKWNAMSDEVKAVRETHVLARDATRRRENARDDEMNDDAMR